jgi:hypothetical protein
MINAPWWVRAACIFVAFGYGLLQTVFHSGRQTGSLGGGTGDVTGLVRLANAGVRSVVTMSQATTYRDESQ